MPNRSFVVLALLLSLVLTGCSKKTTAPGPAASGPHALLTKWGSAGAAAGQFQDPMDVAVGAAGHVFVADMGNTRVQEFLNTGTFVRQWGGFGSGNGQFMEVASIATDGTGNVYVADAGNGRVQVFDPNGGYLRQWGAGGSGDGQFVYPSGIAVDDSGFVYVVDSELHRVQKFTGTGVFLLKWGAVGAGDGEFGLDANSSGPWGVDVDQAGHVYVVDGGNSRVQKFTGGGVFLAKWGSGGSGNGQFDNPSGVAIDRTANPNRVYITDSAFSFSPDPGNHRVQEFTTAGVFVTKWGSLGSGNGQFRYPQGAAVDASGNIFVVDFLNNRVQKFAP
jgi:DNA-binding beta-propeller fold protein YncE